MTQKFKWADYINTILFALFGLSTYFLFWHSMLASKTRLEILLKGLWFLLLLWAFVVDKQKIRKVLFGDGNE